MEIELLPPRNKHVRLKPTSTIETLAAETIMDDDDIFYFNLSPKDVSEITRRDLVSKLVQELMDKHYITISQDHNNSMRATSYHAELDVVKR